MSTVAEYNPLKSIRLPGATIADPTGLVIVIGPNSSGKTLFLQDIQNHLLTGKHQVVVCQGIAANRPGSLPDYLEDLEKNNLLRRMGNLGEQYMPYVATLTDRPGQAKEVPQFHLDQIRKAWEGFVLDEGGNNQSFFTLLGTILVAPLALEMRLNICDSAPGFDWRKIRPTFPLQALYVNTPAKDRLAAETAEVFGNVAWLDTASDPANYHLKVSGSPKAPSIGEITNPIAANTYWSIQKEGDGYKCYVAICLSLMLGIRPVSLIDEPELCLHPPQAYHIGRFIGEHASRQQHVTFVATHSSHALRGMLESGERMKILRLTRNGKDFQAHLLDEQALRQAIKNARTRVEAILVLQRYGERL
jgi:hypothetical protein